MKSPRIMFLYGFFIVICSGIAFLMAPDKSRAMTALYAGGGSAFLMWICAAMAMQIERTRAIGMIGIHVGMVLPFLFAIEFGRRSWKNFHAPEKEYLAIIFAIMAVGSIVAFAAILLTRPSKADRAAAPRSAD